jgi:putative acetyltransferase
VTFLNPRTLKARGAVSVRNPIEAKPFLTAVACGRVGILPHRNVNRPEVRPPNDAPLRGALMGDRLVGISVRPEAPEDRTAIHEVNRLAFGGEDEARLVDALRKGGYVRVSLVAEEDGQVVGHILFGDLSIVTSHGTVEALSLAPMAIAPSHQRLGIGSMLVREGLRACAEVGHRIVVVLGHPGFYPRFGFSTNLAERLKSPYSGPALMTMELVPGALEDVEGEVRYPPPFARL